MILKWKILLSIDFKDIEEKSVHWKSSLGKVAIWLLGQMIILSYFGTTGKAILSLSIKSIVELLKGSIGAHGKGGLSGQVEDQVIEQ